MYLVQVRQCEATLHSGGILTSNSQGLSVRFAFSEDWEGLTKLCVFRAGEQRVDVLLEGESCRIPAELLQPGCRLFVGVRGTGADGMLTLASTFVSLGLILEGAAAGGQEAQELTPTLADRILLGADRAVQAAAASEEACRQTREAADRLLLSRYEALLDAALLRDTATGSPAVLRDCAADLPLKALSVTVPENAAGVESLRLTCTGKNIWDGDRFLEASGWTKENDGSYTGSNIQLYNLFGKNGRSMFGDTDWTEQVTVSFDFRKDEGTSTQNPLLLTIAYSDGTSKTFRYFYPTEFEHFSISSDAGKTVQKIWLSYGGSAVIWLKNFQVEFAGEDTGYEAYRETVYELTLPEPSFGGRVDVLSLARTPTTALGENVIFCEEGAVTAAYHKDSTLAAGA